MVPSPPKQNPDIADLDFGPDGVDVAGEIALALRDGPMRTFHLATAAVVGRTGIEGRVVLRMNGSTWSLAPIEASLVAILLRLEPQLRGADLFADAFCLASREAEAKVDAVHAWSRSIRPTEDLEDGAAA